jgi:hypothetical protein
MSEEKIVTSQSAVTSAIAGDAKSFNDQVKDLLMNRVRDAVELKKMQVSSKFMHDMNNDSEAEESVNEPDGETNVKED